MKTKTVIFLFLCLSTLAAVGAATPTLLMSSSASNGKAYRVFFSCNVESEKLYIDDQDRGVPNGEMILPAGTHRIKVVADGYAVYEQEIKVTKNGQQVKIELRIEPEEDGYDVSFICNVPFAKLSIDGDSYLKASDDIFLSYGRHTVSVTAFGYYDYNVTIQVDRKHRLCQIDMEKNKESINIQVGNVTFKMVFVEGSMFTLGSEDDVNSKPPHQVTVSDFYVGETEVTQVLWEAVMHTNPSYYKGFNHPVENVSWNDCQAFIDALNRLTGMTFRLPTEAEWEYAARGGNGNSNYKYSGGETIGFVAWFNKNAVSSTHPVRQKEPNELGIYDMSGNVEEWCSDWYGTYDGAPQYDPKGPDKGSKRICRGGGIVWPEKYCSVFYRNKYTSDQRLKHIGLRLVLAQ